jgi:hypothetical protein
MFKYHFSNFTKHAFHFIFVCSIAFGSTVIFPFIPNEYSLFFLFQTNILYSSFFISLTLSFHSKLFQLQKLNRFTFLHCFYRNKIITYSRMKNDWLSWMDSDPNLFPFEPFLFFLDNSKTFYETSAIEEAFCRVPKFVGALLFWFSGSGSGGGLFDSVVVGVLVMN